MNIKKLVYLSCLLLGCQILNIQAQGKISTPELTPRMAISPPRVEIQLPDSGLYNGEFAIVNVSTSLLEVELSVFNWDLDENNNTRLIEPTEQSLDQWIIINPLKAAIPAKGTQTIRYGIRPRVKPLKGEHRAIVYIKELPSKEKKENKKIEFRLTYGLPFYANVGKIKRQAIVHNANFQRKIKDELVLAMNIENPGDYYVRPKGFIGVWKNNDYPGDKKSDGILKKISENSAKKDISNKPILSTPIVNAPVLPKNRRLHKTILATNNLPNGNYTARAMVVVGKNKIKKTFNFKH